MVANLGFVQIVSLLYEKITKQINKWIFNNYTKAYLKVANFGLIEGSKYVEFLGRLETVRARYSKLKKIQYPHFFLAY